METFFEACVLPREQHRALIRFLLPQDQKWIRSIHAGLQALWAASQHLLSSLFQFSSARFAVAMAPTALQAGW